MVRLVSGTETNKWLPPIYRKCTFPILRQPAKTHNDIVGSAFLLHYRKIPYVVTAKHVIDVVNPAIAFSKKDRQVLSVCTSALEQAGLKWIEHPADCDIAAIPFHLPLRIVNVLNIKLITEEKWIIQRKFKEGSWIAHLGFPDGGTSNFSDGSSSVFPQAMPGKIMKIMIGTRARFVMETAGTFGASGGPVFLREENNTFSLIGITIKETMLGKHTRPSEAEPLNKTTALPISLVKDIFESEEMVKQYENRVINEEWF